MSISKAAIISWLRQPTTIASIATLVGTATAVALHQMSIDSAAAIAAGALVGLVLPDSTAAKVGAGVLATDLLAVVRSPNAATVGHLVSDAASMAVSVETASGGTATASMSISGNAEGAAPAIAAAVPAMVAAAEDAAAKA